MQFCWKFRFIIKYIKIVIFNSIKCQTIITIQEIHYDNNIIIAV